MKSKRQEIKKHSLDRVSDIFSLPKDVVLSDMLVKVTGCSEVIVENYRSISEYNNCAIRLQGKTSRLAITGKFLTIVHFSDKTIIIRGKICEVKFL